MATYYYHPTLGDNTRSSVQAQNQATPWKAPPKFALASGNVPSNYTSGDLHLLARGQHWYNITTVQFGTSDVGAILGAWGYGPLPIVDVRKHFTADDWEAYPGYPNLWRTKASVLSTLITSNFSRLSVRRLFFNEIGQSFEATSLGTITSEDPWWYDDVNNWIVVFTGSATTNPHDLWQMISCTQSRGDGGGGEHVFRCYGSSDLAFRDIAMYGSNAASLQMIQVTDANNVENVVVENCELRYWALHGVYTLISSAVSTSEHILDPVIRGNVIDKMWQQQENSQTGVQRGSGDGVGLTGTQGALIEWNTIQDAYHSCINMNGATGRGSVNNNIVRFNDLSAPVSNYCRQMAISGATNRCNDNEAYGNWGYGMTARNQIEGRRTNFHHNVIDLVVDYETYTYTVGQTMTAACRSNAEVNECKWNNNVFILDSDQIVVRFSNNAGFNWTGTSEFKNNVVIQFGDAATDCETLRITKNSGALDVEIHNNVLYMPEDQYSINVDGSVYSVETAEAAHSDLFANNMDVHPEIRDDYYPIPNSPCVNAGTTVANTVDFTNQYKEVSGYDIGAVWYHEPTTDGVDGASYQTFKLNHTQPVAVYISPSESPSAGAVLDTLIKGVHGFWGINRHNKLMISSATYPASVKYEFLESDIVSLERITTFSPVYYARADYDRSWTIQDESVIGGSATDAQRQFVANEVRNTSIERKYVRDLYPNAQRLELRSFFEEEAGAEEILTRILNLLGGTPDVYKVRIAYPTHDLNVGDTVKITYSRFGMDAGVSFVIIGLAEVQKDTTYTIVKYV